MDLVIRHLSIGYKGRSVGSGLDGSVPGGQLTCLLGVNGVGKSTLLRTLAGLQPALSGEVELSSDDGGRVVMNELSKQEMARNVAVVLTEQPDVQHVTVGDMVGMGRMPYTGFFGRLRREDRRIVAESLRLTGLNAFALRQFGALSDGERQKVMIAKALAQQTPVVLLDEPTAFLDYPSKVEMMRLLRRLAEETGKTILLSTHDIDLALRFADRQLLLDGSGLREIGKEELRQYMVRTQSQGGAGSSASLGECL